MPSTCKRLRFLIGNAVFLFCGMVCGASPLPKTQLSLQAFGGATNALTLNTNGALIAWPPDTIESTTSPAGAGEIIYGEHHLQLKSPQFLRTRGPVVALSYTWPELPSVRVRIENYFHFADGTGIWTREMQIQGDAHLTNDLTVSLQSWPLSPGTWLPLHNGTGKTLGTNEAAMYRFAGSLPAKGARLAMPLVSIPVEISRSRALVATDPYFSTLFKSNVIEWTYPAKGGLENGCEHRTIVVAMNDGNIETSLNDYFQYLLPNVKPGPDWLHDIAFVDFDYLSDGGQGWFHDVDALNTALPKEDHAKAFLCVHGCYDFLGRYCFDSKAGKLDKEWVSFSSFEQARKAHPFGNIGGDRVPMGFGNCQPQKMSLAEVHRRLRYARERGFRTGIYFADGMNAGDGLPDFTPDRVLRRGGWQGPDSKGKSYFQNPLNPKVHAFFIDYAKAMLAEYGPDLDAMIWDETFHVTCGELGTDAWPGYADRAMMRLTHQITALVDDYNQQHGTQIAFLTSDDIGALNGVDAAPYALVAHGTYQDSWCQPKAWSYGIFPNYRNVMWSVCWWPVSKWAWVDFGVHEYQSPVSISNGWGNDTGFSEMTPEQQKRVIDLFNWRKGQRTRLKWFEELPAQPGK